MDRKWQTTRAVSVRVSVLTTHTHTSQPTKRSAFSRPSAVSKAALPNEKLHPVVLTCLDALLPPKECNFKTTKVNCVSVQQLQDVALSLTAASAE